MPPIQIAALLFAIGVVLMGLGKIVAPPWFAQVAWVLFIVAVVIWYDASYGHVLLGVGK